MLFGALEAGGTKMVCAVGNEKGEILERISIPTETPEATMPRMAEFLPVKASPPWESVAFGPVYLNRASKTYGYITTTPRRPGKITIYADISETASASP